MIARVRKMFHRGILLIAFPILVATSVYLFTKVLDYKERLWHYKIYSHPTYDGELIQQNGVSDVIWVLGDSRIAEWRRPDDIGNTQWVNRGVSGLTSGEVLTRFSGDIKRNSSPQWVVLQCGINDIQGCGYGNISIDDVTERVSNNINKIISIAKEHNCAIVLTTIIPKGPNSIRESFLWNDKMHLAVQQINQQIRKKTAEGCIVLDTEMLVSVDGRTLKKFSRDGLHLNEKGYALLSAKIAEIIESKINKVPN